MAYCRLGLARLPVLQPAPPYISISRCSSPIRFLCQRKRISLQSTTYRPNSVHAQPAPYPTYFQPPPPPNPPRRLRRFLSTTSLITIFGILGIATALQLNGAIMSDLINPITDEETLTLFAPIPGSEAEKVDARILMHPIAEALRRDSRYTEARPHMKIPELLRPHNFTAGTLLGPGMFEVPPLSFTDTESELPSMISLQYLGSKLCGHPGIIHGGVLATILDEGLARACFPALPNKVGVTASLKLDYRLPCPVGEIIVLRAETTKVEGRKAWVKGSLFIPKDGEELVIAEAEALFVEPKAAKHMSKLYSSS